MIESLFAKLGAFLLAPVLLIQGLFVAEPISTPVGVDLPSGTALFESSLAAPLSESATTMTLASVSVRGGGVLSGYQCFTLDEGSAQAEFVCGIASSTVVSNLERGLSPSDGLTEVTSLKFSHRRGSSVKITDFPLLQRLKAQANGDATYQAPLVYSTSVSTSTLGVNGQHLASVAYANSLSFGAVAQASELAAGFVELATGVEAASSTLSGSAARLALSTAIATSTAPTIGNVVVVTQSNGDIAAGFLPDTVGSSTVRYITTTGTTTYTKPSNLKRISIEMCGAGGAGGGAVDASSAVGTGGGAGGFLRKVILASSLNATSSVFVGAGGVGVLGATGGSGSTTLFAGIATTTGGIGGVENTTTGSQLGGFGGMATGGDMNMNGQMGDSAIGSSAISGRGGSSPLGTGGFSVSGSSVPGSAATGFCAGGSGARDTAAGINGIGGAGTNGVVIITEYF